MEKKTTTFSDSFFVKEIDDSHILWLEKGNRFIKIEEPVLYVLNKLLDGDPLEDIIDKTVDRYKVDHAEGRDFVNQIMTEIVGREWTIQPNPDLQHPHQGNHVLEDFIPSSVRYYYINGKNFCFRFGKQLYEHFIHPLFQHYESTSNTENVSFFELKEVDGQVALIVNQQLKGSWKETDSHLIKGMAFLQMLNIINGKTDNDWMAIIHASAISDHSKAVLFTGSSGSGKSTFAALLQQNGYHLLSDDFVPIESGSMNAFPFQAALSVKEGAKQLLSPYYSSMEDKTSTIRSGKKVVGYLPPFNETKPVPVKEIVFIKFNPMVDFETKEIPGIDALKMFLEETWTNPVKHNATFFLDWFKTLRFYKMDYSNNLMAIEYIKNLFAN